MGGQTEVEEFFQIGQAAAEGLPVVFACFDESRQPLELLAADGCLRIEGLQIVAQMTVDIFVVVAFG